MKNKLKTLKAINLNNLDISLAVMKKYTVQRTARYNLRFVSLDDELKNKLKDILSDSIESVNVAELYSFDCPEPETDEIRVMEYEQTDFYGILEQLENLNPEEDRITNVDQLVDTQAYLIVTRDNEGIKMIGFSRVPENWKKVKKNRFIPLLFKDLEFQDLQEDNVFRISGNLDFIYSEEHLFIFSKRAFEQGLNFREGMISKADVFYSKVEETGIFVGIDILKVYVGNNLRHLRKIATIENLGYYQNPEFIQRVEEVNGLRDWEINIDTGIITITEDTIEGIFSVLQNKRLRSEITEEDFDADSIRNIQRGDEG